MNFDTLTIENHSERNDAIRKLREGYKDHLQLELNEKLEIIESGKMKEGKGERPATAEEIGKAYDAAIQMIGTVDKTEAQLKSWAPPPPQNLPAATSDPPPDANWLIDLWMPQGEITILAGTGEIGKSHIALQIACAFACGWPKHYLDIQHKPQESNDTPMPPMKTMFATWEDSHGSVQRRIHRINKTMTNWLDIAKVQEHVIYRDMKPQGPLWVPSTESGHIANRGNISNPGHDLLFECKEKEIDLLILDSIVAVYGQDINSATHVREFLNTLGAWCNDSGITILLIGHPNKSDPSGVSGSVDWTNGVRSVWTLAVEANEKDDNGKAVEGTKYYSLNHYKVNDAPKQPSKPLERQKNGIWIESISTNKAIQAYKDHQQRWQKKEGKHEKSDKEEV